MNCTFQNMPIKHCGCARHIIANSNLVKKKKSLHKIFHVSTHITVCENTNTAKPSTTIFPLLTLKKNTGKV